MSDPPNTSTNFYTILECPDTATYEELKQSYQRLVRQHHPDKQRNESNCSTVDRCKYLQIDKAWRVLRDEDTRSKYNALQCQDNIDNDNDSSLIYARLDRRDLSFDDQSMSSYPCRCGSQFTIYQEYFVQGDDDDNECIIECSECSNCIVVR